MTSSSESTEYTIQKGDTLGDIAQKFYGNTNHYKKLAGYNSIENPDIIEAGKTIKIPTHMYFVQSIEKATKNNQDFFRISMPIVTIDGEIGTDDIICYCPLKKQYFIIRSEDTDGFIEEIEEVNALGKKIKAFHESVKKSSNKMKKGSRGRTEHQHRKHGSGQK